MSKKLTPKQAEFLNCILAGDTQVVAYKKVYSTKSTNEQTVKTNASKLFNSEVIQEHYKTHIETLSQKALYTREQAIEDLKLVIDAGKKDLLKKGLKFTNVLAITKATEQLSTLLFVNQIDSQKLELEKEKLELAKSKLQKDNNNLQLENANLLREIVKNAATNKKTE